MRRTLVLFSTVAIFAGCSSGEVPGSASGPFAAGGATAASSVIPHSAAAIQPPEAADARGGRLPSLRVFTLANGAARNAVFEYAARNGRLRFDESFPTGGLGDPTVAGTVQGSLATSDDGRFLFAVNAGSNEITSFRINADGLRLVDRVASRGAQPVSLAVRRNLLFVLNEASSSISGFRVTRNGALRAIPHSTAMLSGSGVGPAEISFDDSGRVLVVTEKNTNNIDTYAVMHGIPAGPTVHASSGMTPFGFAFVPRTDTLVVSEAFGGTAGAGAASSYALSPPSTLTPISSSVPDDNTAPCWFVITRNGALAFTSNTASNTISAYALDAQGNLTLTTPDGISAHTGSSPTDLALAADRFLFVLNLKSRTIGAYAVKTGGKLRPVSGARGLPASAMGLVVTP